jgi:hypothetical protein
VAKIQRIFDGVAFKHNHFLAPIAAASFFAVEKCGGKKDIAESGKSYLQKDENESFSSPE